MHKFRCTKKQNGISITLNLVQDKLGTTYFGTQSNQMAYQKSLKWVQNKLGARTFGTQSNQMAYT